MGLFICLRFLDYITYTVFYGTLTLFLIHGEGMSSSMALMIMGGFIGLNYGCSLLGGALLEWVSDLRLPLFFGVTLHFLGVLVFFKFGMIFLGLSLFVMGSLAFESSFFLVLTRLYQNNLARLQKAFYFNYLAINIGGLIGFTLGGFMQQSNSTHFVVIASIAAFACSFTILCARFTFIATTKTAIATFTSLYQFVLYPLLLLLAGGVIFTLFKFVSLVSSLVMGLWLITYLSIWGVLFLKQRCKRYPAYVHFLVLTLAYLLFWSVYFVIPTLMALFLNSNVDLHFYHFEFSPAWFINIMCLVVIAGILRTVGVFNRHALNLERHFALGFVLQTLALMVLSAGIFVSGGHQVALLWAVLYFVIQALAEFALAPIAFSSVGQMIAPKFQPFFTGVWLSTLGVSVLIASKISEILAPKLHSTVADNSMYMHLFMYLGAVSLIGLLLVGFKHYVLGRLLPTESTPTTQA